MMMSSGNQLSQADVCIYKHAIDHWEPIDGGSSRIVIMKEEKDDRLVAWGRNQQVLINEWITNNLSFEKKTDIFYSLTIRGTIYGIEFDFMTVMEFTATLLDCINLAVLSQKVTMLQLHGLPPPPEASESQKPLPIPVGLPLPPPLLGTSRPSLTKSPSFPGESTKSLAHIGGGSGTWGKKSHGRNKSLDVAKELKGHRTLTLGELDGTMRPKVKNLKTKKGMKDLENTSRLSLSKATNESLRNVAIRFEEQCLVLLKGINEAVRTGSVIQLSAPLRDIVDMLSVALIMCKQPKCSAYIHKKIETETKRLANISIQGEVEETAVKAAVGASYKLVKSNLANRIHNDLDGVQNLAIQLKCLLTLIASWIVDHASMIQLFATLNSFFTVVTRLMNSVKTFSAISLNLGAQNQIRRTASSSDMIWSECLGLKSSDCIEVREDGHKLTTLNRLVFKLTSSEYDNQLVKTFLMTYRSFTTPWGLLEKFQELNEFPKNFSAQEITLRRQKMLMVLKHWFNWTLDDFDDDLLQELRNFINNLGEDGPTPKKIAEDLLRDLDRLVWEREQRTELWFREPSIVEIPEDGLCLYHLFLQESSKVLAEQMTLIDHQLYCGIRPAELLDQSWTKEHLKHRSPNVIYITGRSNDLPFWVAMMILSQENVDLMVKMYEKMIDIAKVLESFKNYFTLQWVLAGLEFSPVSRLKIGEKISSKMSSTLRDLNELMGFTENVKYYRQAVINATAPAIPSVPTHLKDLVFIEDGNSSIVSEKINWRKRESLMETINLLLNFQLGEYPFLEVEPFYTFLRELPTLSQEELFQLSESIKPPKKKITAISNK
eukprot:TRINITY_DN3396_c0_g1_i2.p1 TRINITY_DN3396_c0_g1~~TRINITY_DN3396_c0_g1_i2.p1  ORF type:complete len:830 (+),score=240.76 TRINITY_DN3396_c0_g1_i2:51-2540(+)